MSARRVRLNAIDDRGYHQSLMMIGNDVRRAVELLKEKQRVVLICHANPDGDALGALLGMGLLLERHMQELPIRMVCKDAVPPTFTFLPSSSRVFSDPDLRDGDAVIVLDTAEPKLTGFHESHPQIFDGTYPSICIDHHPTNSRFATVPIIVPESASSCEIVLAFAEDAGWAVDSDIATCLLTGVYTDTGGLLHSNTTTSVYRTVGKLLRAGARRQEMVQQVFRTAKLSTLKLWGRVLEKITISEEGGAISAVTQGDFRATGADYSELTGAVDYLNAVPGMRFSLILSERDGKVKGSLRTLRDDVDVSAMAGKFQGGGHRRAAGFALPGKLQPEVRWKVVEEEK